MPLEKNYAGKPKGSFRATRYGSCSSCGGYILPREWMGLTFARAPLCLDCFEVQEYASRM